MGVGPERNSWGRVALVLAGALSVVPLLPQMRAASQSIASTTWLSSPGAGLPAGLTAGASSEPAISADGTVVAFTVSAAGQVGRSPSGRSEVFVHDSGRLPGSEIEQVSVGSDAVPAASGSSSQPSVSCDGRFVAFTSEAAFDPDDRDGGALDVYVRDRATGTTELVSAALPRDAVGAATVAGNVSSPAISADGRYVAMVATAVTQTRLVGSQVYVYDRVEQVAKLISKPSGAVDAADADSFAPAISADGGAIAFVSSADLDPTASGIASGQAPPTTRIFVWQRNDESVTPVSVGLRGERPNGPCGPPAISQGGRLVAYACLADNLVPDDNNRAGDVFVTDWAARRTSLASVTNGGGRANGDACLAIEPGRCDARVTISGDGRFVGFSSTATNLLSDASQEIAGVRLSQLPAGGLQDRNELTDVFVRDFESARTYRASVRSGGEEVSDGTSTAPVISTGGRRTAFLSTSRALTEGRCHPTSCPANVFVRNDPVLCFPCTGPECPPAPVVPELRLPSAVVPEGRVAIGRGVGFQPSATVDISFDDRPAGAVTADAGGAFEALVPVPHGTPIGMHSVTVRSGSRSAKTTFLVVRPTVQPPFGSVS